MQIKTITYGMKRSNGNYGSDDVVLEAILQDGENPIKALKDLEYLADYKLNGERREQLAHEQYDILQSDVATEDQKEKARKFLKEYNPWIIAVSEASRALVVAKAFPVSEAAVPQFPVDPIAHTISDMLTPKQLGMIRTVCRENNLDPEEECIAVMKCKVNDLSRRAASSLIDHLLAISTPAVPIRRAG